MQLDVINQRVLSRNGFPAALFAVILICLFLSAPCVGSSSDPNGNKGSGSGELAADGNDVDKDSNGPTMIMSYSREEFVKNPIASFMYFVPLVAPTLVDNISSANNGQQVGIVSYEKKVTSKSFNVVCEFEILGHGFHMNTFDSEGMINAHIDELKKGETMTHMLDYIKFEGEGLGIIEVKGTMDGSVPTVIEVNLMFNAKGHKSPVTIGLYDVKPKDGIYKYENRSKRTFARVNTLSFKKTDETPHMGIKVASISDAEEPDGFYSSIKGAIANLFITPPKVDKFGNDTMLNFGCVLLKQQPAFTFPKAKNIKENKLAVN